VSKPSHPRGFVPARWSAALALLAIVAVAVAGGLRSPSRTTGMRLAATVPRMGPTLSAEQSSWASPSKARVSRVRANKVRASLTTLPLAFEANQGQTDPQVKYMARGNGYTVFLTASDTVFALNSSSQAPQNLALRGARNLGPASKLASKPSTKPLPSNHRTAAIRMHLIGGNPQSQIIADNELPGRSNYFLGNDPSQWHTDVEQYERISYRDVYPGINMAFYGVQKQLEFDFIVVPGAIPDGIRFAVAGAHRIATDNSGNLVLASSAGNVLLHKPVAYQQKDGTRQPVDARFVLQADNQVSFEIGNYDRSRELVIDPSVSYATYLGGTAEDDGNAVAIDSSGNAYVTGQTKSTDFPTKSPLYGTNKGGFDVFVTKLSPTGSLVYSTYIGGSGDDSGNAIALDASGNVFVAGGTKSSDFPTLGAYQSTLKGASNAFVLELNSTGSTLMYSTFLGGTGSDVANGLALDSSGNAYVAGSTTSTDFPPKNPLPSETAGGFVSELNSSGNALVYSTYLGAGPRDFAAAVTVDAAGKAYVTGGTQSPTFKTTTGVVQSTCGTDANCNGAVYDAFVSVIQAGGGSLFYSTFLGGSASDEGLGIAIDSAGDAYVTGVTQSSNFPPKNPIQANFGGVQDAFVTELNPAGTALLYSTYLGGTSSDAGSGIAVDGSGNAYVTGETGSSNFPVSLNATQPKSGGGNDAFISEIKSGGSALVFSTYLGGSLNENTSTINGGGSLAGIAVDSAGANIYVTGSTASTDFPAVAAEQPTSGLTGDAFVAKYSLAGGTADFTIASSALNPASVGTGASATSTITVTAVNSFNSAVALTCAVSPAGAGAPTCSFNPASITPATPSTLTVATTASTTAGSYTIAVTGTSGALVHTTSPLSLTVTAAPDFTIAATALAAVAQGGSTTSTITIAPVNGYSGTVHFVCSVSSVSGGTPLPTCSIPNSVAGGSGTSTLTVNTTGAASAMYRGTDVLPYAMWFPVLGLSLVGMRFSAAESRKKKLVGILLLGLIITALFFLPACSSTSSGGGGGCSGCTPKGTYGVTVTGADINLNLSHSTVLTLTVN
jgi:Beta-propeller repeat